MRRLVSLLSVIALTLGTVALLGAPSADAVGQRWSARLDDARKDAPARVDITTARTAGTPTRVRVAFKVRHLVRRGHLRFTLYYGDNDFVVDVVKTRKRVLKKVCYRTETEPCNPWVRMRHSSVSWNTKRSVVVVVLTKRDAVAAYPACRTNDCSGGFFTGPTDEHGYHEYGTVLGAGRLSLGRAVDYVGDQEYIDEIEYSRS